MDLRGTLYLSECDIDLEDGYSIQWLRIALSPDFAVVLTSPAAARKLRDALTDFLVEQEVGAAPIPAAEAAIAAGESLADEVKGIP